MAFRPTGEFGLPHGYSPVASDVLDMPCCKCIAVMCAREDGTILAIFEHETAHPPWFGDRPAIQAHCSDQSVRLVQLGVNHLAATWPLNDRYVTIIGARDIDEIARLVSHFSNLN
ncbi:MAG: anti-sigma factor [Planctomycetaceae bacterium]|nr:anti-sigma factor [Planctomycetaceae bacterium]